MQMIREHPISWGLPMILIAGGLIWVFFEPIHDAYISLLGWIFAMQQEFHGELTKNIGAVADNSGWSAAVALATVSFLYGVFHAAGPGHGKVILSTYLLSQPEKVKKSALLAAASSLVQGLTAIVLVYGLFYLFGLVSRDMKLAVAWSERLAFVLVLVIGLVLLWRGIRGFGWLKPKSEHSAKHAHDHHHHHDHHHNEDGVCSTCGHAHVPTNEQVDNADGWMAALGIVFSIGLRPCTGAVLVLVFARFSQIPWAGVMAVLAMSIGTAITVSTLAILSVKARELAMYFLKSSSGLATTLSNSVAMIGGIVLIFIGYGLITSSFDAPVRSMGL